MEESVETRITALLLKVTDLTNQIELLRIEKEVVLDEVTNLQLKKLLED